MSEITFEEAIDLLPKCLVGNLDPFHHKSIADLKFMAQTELDLYEEGEIKLSQTDLESIRRFVCRLSNVRYHQLAKPNTRER